MEIIPEISDYEDLIKKLEYDMSRYRKNNHSYELIDCLMALNALPEWIKKSEKSSTDLKNLALYKERIMKGQGAFELDENLIESSIDHQLRFIRLFCNHSKHRTESGQIPKIMSQFGATLPITLPAKLYNIIALGNKRFDAEYLIIQVYEFWKNEISKEIHLN